TGPGWRLFPPTWSASAPEGGRRSNIAALSESGSAAWPASSVIEDSVPPPRRERRALASGRAVTLLEELEELNPFPQPALHHLRAADHLVDDRGDLRRPEVKPPVERLHVVEDFRVRQMRIMQRRDLYAAVIDQLRVVRVEPAVLDRLLVEERPRVWRGQGNLDRVRVDLGGEADGFLDRLPRLPRQAEDERAVNLHTQFMAVTGEFPRDLDSHALLDVVQDLLVAALIAHQQQAQAVVL